MTTADADTPRHADPSGTSTTSLDARGEPLPRASAAGITPDRSTPRGCPYLVSEEGGWRLGSPSREHRCGAFAPPAALAPEKQSRLCLTPRHTGCATYVASLNARTERVGVPPERRATRWGLARTTTVIEDAGGIRGRVLGIVLDRWRWQAIPAVILVTTLFVLLLSGLRTGVPATAVSTSSPLAVGPRAAASDGLSAPSNAVAASSAERRSVRQSLRHHRSRPRAFGRTG
jgi:hypothetical protein